MLMRLSSKHALPLPARVIAAAVVTMYGLYALHLTARERLVTSSTQLTRPRILPLTTRALATMHASLASKPMLQARRNHGCAFLNHTMVLAGGRHAPSIEVWDINTGRQELVVADQPLLDINHFQLLVVDKVVGIDAYNDPKGRRPGEDTAGSSPKEIWIPCGFVGSDVNSETNSNHTVIIDPDQGFSVRLGPRIDQPRGACGALALDLDGPGAPQHICMFGGSIGAHDGGKFTKTVSCYDRVRQQWHRPLPHLPMPADHLNVVHIPAGVRCGDGESGPPSPERLMYFNFRDGTYATQRPEIFALDIKRDGQGRIVFDDDDTNNNDVVGGGWYLLGSSDQPSQATSPEFAWKSTRDAAGVEVSPSGRFVFTFGGVHYPRTDDADERSPKKLYNYAEVRAIDVCTGTLIDMPDSTRMQAERFAVVTCRNANYKAVTCGGTNTASHYTNLGSCDVHDLYDLEKMAFAAASSVQSGGAALRA